MDADERSEVRRVLALYPQVWHACHARHPRSGLALLARGCRELAERRRS